MAIATALAADGVVPRNAYYAETPAGGPSLLSRSFTSGAGTVRDGGFRGNTMVMVCGERRAGSVAVGTTTAW